MHFLPASFSNIKIQSKGFIKMMIKNPLFKIKTKIQTKKLQFELDQLQKQRDKAYALHLSMLEQVSNAISNNQVAEPQQQVAEQQQIQLIQEDECCCCCCCYGCDLSYEYDDNFANENLENMQYIC